MTRQPDPELQTDGLASVAILAMAVMSVGGVAFLVAVLTAPVAEAPVAAVPVAVGLAIAIGLGLVTLALTRSRPARVRSKRR